MDARTTRMLRLGLTLSLLAVALCAPMAAGGPSSAAGTIGQPQPALDHAMAASASVLGTAHRSTPNVVAVAAALLAVALTGSARLLVSGQPNSGVREARYVVPLRI